MDEQCTFEHAYQLWRDESLPIAERINLSRILAIRFTIAEVPPHLLDLLQFWMEHYGRVDSRSTCFIGLCIENVSRLMNHAQFFISNQFHCRLIELLLFVILSIYCDFYIPALLGREFHQARKLLTSSKTFSLQIQTASLRH